MHLKPSLTLSYIDCEYTHIINICLECDRSKIKLYTFMKFVNTYVFKENLSFDRYI